MSNNRGPGLSKLSEITQHIFISDLEVSMDIDTLKSEGIEAILHIGDGEKSKKILNRYKRKKIDHHFVEFEDNPNVDIVPYFEPCYDYIHKYVSEEKKVLIHCAAGVSRSPTIVAYYMLKRYYLVSFDTSMKKNKKLINKQEYFVQNILKMIKDNRACIYPNVGFVQQILLTEYRLKKYFEGIIRKKYGEGYGKQKPDESSESESEESDLEDKNIDVIVDETAKKTKKVGKKDNNGKYDVLEDLRDISPKKNE